MLSLLGAALIFFILPPQQNPCSPHTDTSWALDLGRGAHTSGSSQLVRHITPALTGTSMVPELHLLNRSLQNEITAKRYPLLVIGENMPPFTISSLFSPCHFHFPHHCKASWMWDSVYPPVIDKTKTKSLLRSIAFHTLWLTAVCSRYLGYVSWDESEAAAAVAQRMVPGMLVVLTMLRMLKMMLEIMDRMLEMLERPVEMLEVVKEQQVWKN